jgi:hypothetical protein
MPLAGGLGSGLFPGACSGGRPKPVEGWRASGWVLSQSIGETTRDHPAGIVPGEAPNSAANQHLHTPMQKRMSSAFLPTCPQGRRNPGMCIVVPNAAIWVR